MREKDNESQNGFFKFSENLTETMGPVFRWILKHSIALLLVIAVVGFIWRSIFHHYVDGMKLSESLSVAFVEIVSIYLVLLLIGVAAFLCLKIVAAVLKTIGQRNAKKKAAIELQPLDYEVEQEETVEEIKIDADILKVYLNTKIMRQAYGDGGNTVFDEIVKTFEKMLKLHRKGAKSENNFSDMHFIQAATLLYQKRYMNTRDTFFTDWCISLFKALHLEQPKNIKKVKPEKKIINIFNFIPKD